jgi:4-hydroxyproline epimerase
MRRVKVIDSHTGGEPTRVVVDGLPELGRGSLAERRERFARTSTASARPASTSRAAQT